MRLTRSVGYAVGILLRVNGQRTDGPVTAAEIADGCEFPPRFLYRVLRRLVDAGLITGVSGPGGGYALARPAREITLLSIVVAIDGPIAPSSLEPVHRRQRKALDAINGLCARNADGFAKELGRINLAKLAEV
jgi:Rrf2 family protein